MFILLFYINPIDILFYIFRFPSPVKVSRQQNQAISHLKTEIVGLQAKLKAYTSKTDSILGEEAKNMSWKELVIEHITLRVRIKRIEDALYNRK